MSSKKFLAGIVRVLFVLHSFVVVLRVATATGEDLLWCLLLANVFLIVEGIAVFRCKDGIEWKWWCPCYLIYLFSTLPALWILQLSQNDKLRAAAFDESKNNVQPNTNTVSGMLEYIDDLVGFGNSTWIVVMQELLVYLTVFGHLVLPRDGVYGVVLADRLLVYLTMGSDIMDFYTLFDEHVVQMDRCVTYSILVIWSLSLLQFVPVLTQMNEKAEFKSSLFRSTHGDHFSEVVETIFSITVQDLLFCCMRLYIMVRFKLITYSLVFFVLKNIVSLGLLIYRLLNLCCNHTKNRVERLIKMKETNQGASYLVQWTDKENPTWEPASRLSKSLTECYMTPAVDDRRLEDAANEFESKINSSFTTENLREKVSDKIELGLDVFRYVFSSDSEIVVKMEDADKKLSKLPLSDSWYYMERDGRGVRVTFPMTITPILHMEYTYENKLEKVIIIEEWSLSYHLVTYNCEKRESTTREVVSALPIKTSRGLSARARFCDSPI